jgi:seryl-tRNA synthetase
VLAVTEDLEKIHELITTVRLDIREINTKMDGIKDLTKKVEEIQVVANDALQSTKAAHLRLGEQATKVEASENHYDNELKSVNLRIENETKGVYSRIETDNEKRRQGMRWLVGTLIASGGLIATILTIILRTVGK